MNLLRHNLERMFQDWDQAEMATGPFACRYVEEYEGDSDIQGVTRTILLPRHIAQERALTVGASITTIKTVDGRRIGPFTVETFEPQSDGTALLRLRGA